MAQIEGEGRIIKWCLAVINDLRRDCFAVGTISTVDTVWGGGADVIVSVLVLDLIYFIVSLKVHSHLQYQYNRKETLRWHMNQSSRWNLTNESRKRDRKELLEWAELPEHLRSIVVDNKKMAKQIVILQAEVAEKTRLIDRLKEQLDCSVI